MTALVNKRQTDFSKWRNRVLTLKSGEKAYLGGIALGDPSTGKVLNGASATGKLFLGLFAESVDASATGFNADSDVNVDFMQEITAGWFANDGGITIADRFNPAYVADDQTVSKTSTNRSLMGTILDVDSIDGVLVAIGRPFLENT